MALSKDWRDLPAELAPGVGEAVADWHARIAAYQAANPGVLTPLSATALEDLEARTQAELNTKAPIASPALTGTPTAPTAAAATDTTQVATTAFVGATTVTDSHVQNVGSIPASSTVSFTMPLPRAVVGDPVFVSSNGALVAGVVMWATVIADDIVTVVVANVTTAAVSVGNRTYKVGVIK